MTEMPLESPPEDVVEQRTEVYSGRPPSVSGRTDTAFEADPADARDQADEVPLDDEDWR